MPPPTWKAIVDKAIIDKAIIDKAIIDKSITSGSEEDVVRLCTARVNSPGDLGRMVGLLAARRRYATIGEVIRVSGWKGGTMTICARPDVDWIAARTEMEKTGVLDQPLLGAKPYYVNHRMVGEWLLDDLCYLGEPAEVILAYARFVTPGGLCYIIDKYGPVRLCDRAHDPRQARTDATRALCTAAWAKNKDNPRWPELLVLIASTISGELASEIIRDCGMSFFTEADLCLQVLNGPILRGRLECRNSNHREIGRWLARRIREDKIILSDNDLNGLASLLWFEAAAEALRTRHNTYDISGLCKDVLQVLLRCYLTLPEGAWRGWGRFKRGALRRFRRPDLRSMFIDGGRMHFSISTSTATEFGFASVELINPPECGDYAVRLFASWHPVVHEDWRTLYVEKVVALLDLLRQMERRARRGDLCAVSKRNISIRDFFLLVRDYL